MGNWRVAGSLLTLLAEVNAAYPDRDKRTDGAISGYPGSVSSHNVNSEGVVCALDITTGDYGDGISTADGQALAEAVRIAARDQPRGIPVYPIHYMAPPYVPTPGPYIATAGTNWAWDHYFGSDLHTSHLHISADWDIPTGGSPSGQADYDSTLPWLTTAPLTDMDIDMATPEQVSEAMMKHPITVDGETMRYQDWIVRLVRNTRGTLKSEQIITAADGKTKAPVSLVLANLGADVRAVKTKTDKLK